MKIKPLFLFLIALAFSCAKEKHQPGICLSFDDRSIKEWFELRDLINQYNVKATFFISQFDSLSFNEIAMLHTLEKDGHEIASHGALHLDAEKFIKEHSYKEYIKTEIDPSISWMKKNGFTPFSFAYPYGSKYWFTDYILLKRFKCTRGVADMRREKDPSKHNEIFFQFDENRKFTALGIDRASQLTNEIILNAINRSNKQNEVLMLYAHLPSTSISDDYSFDIAFLKFILEESKKRNMKFYRFKDLIK